LPMPVLLAALLAASPAIAQGPEEESPARAPTAQEILDASPDSDWREPDPENTLYMELEGGRVGIELAPGFAPGHVDHSRPLARDGLWAAPPTARPPDH